MTGVIGWTIGTEEQKDSPIPALAETLSLFLAFVLLIKYLETTWVNPLQYALVGWDFFAHLMMAAMPAAAVYLSGGGLSDLGVSIEEFSDKETRKTMAVLFLEIGAVWVLAVLIPGWLSGKSLYLLLPPEFFGDHAGLPPLFENYAGWFLTVLFTVVFCGVGEEVMFRGYIQGRLNRAFGRPWKIMGVSFGWGLLISTALFGLGHGVAYFNPFDSSFTLSGFEAGPALITAAQGLIFGLLYEKGRGIALPAALHGSIGLFFGAFAIGYPA